jgi:adenosylhomocysteine nucleosidase
VRTISDRADDDATVDFTRFLAEVASHYSAHIVDNWLKAMSETRITVNIVNTAP